MADQWQLGISIATDASGAYRAAQAGQVVLVVDLIDMSTTLEGALQAGASLVLGASPIPCRAPVPLDPQAIGSYAAAQASAKGWKVVLIAEPRAGSEEERRGRCAGVLAGLQQGGIEIERIYPNLGAETAKLVDFRERIVVAVTDCGGTAFDAAFNAGAQVVTGTLARTFGHSGWDNAETAVHRALTIAEREQRGLCIVASSGKALEDVLATQYLAQRALELSLRR